MRKRTFVGTPWYMAPEVIEDQPYSQKADIWSLACCLLHLVTGRRPFDKTTPVQALRHMTMKKSPLVDVEKEVLNGLKEKKDLWNFL